MNHIAVLFVVLMLALPVKADITIPPLAYKLRPTVIREVRFWWSMDEPTSTFHAQVHQESLWNPEAESHAGAKGLTQFMPATADWISKLYPKDLGENQPLDPRWAIRAMVIYDKFLYDRIDADEKWEMVLSAYNGGLTWVKRDQSLTEQNGLDKRKWWNNVELYSNRSSSAFKENRGYPRRILLVLKPIYEKEGF